MLKINFELSFKEQPHRMKYPHQGTNMRKAMKFRKKVVNLKKFRETQELEKQKI